MKTKKIVIWKDGSYKFINDGITWEYENDTDWLTTISLADLYPEADIYINVNNLWELYKNVWSITKVRLKDFFKTLT